MITCNKCSGFTKFGNAWKFEELDLLKFMEDAGKSAAEIQIELAAIGYHRTIDAINRKLYDLRLDPNLIEKVDPNQVVSTGWSTEEEEAMTKLWKSGLMTSEIAIEMDKLGYHRTAASIAGKAQRIGLANHAWKEDE